MKKGYPLSQISIKKSASKFIIQKQGFSLEKESITGEFFFFYYKKKQINNSFCLDLEQEKGIDKINILTCHHQNKKASNVCCFTIAKVLHKMF
jgi:hypothetical protein